MGGKREEAVLRLLSRLERRALGLQGAHFVLTVAGKREDTSGALRQLKGVSKADDAAALRSGGGRDPVFFCRKT